MSKNLQPLQSFEVMTMNQNELQEIFESNQGGDEINQGDLERIKIPSGGGQFWEIPALEGTQSEKEFNAIIVAWKKSRSYWEDKYSGGGEKPDCRSTDGVYGIGHPGGECAKCHLAKWEDDNPPACVDQRVLFLLFEDSTLPVLFVLPPTSIPVMRKYFVKLTSRKIPHWAVVTQFKLEKVTNPAGQPYSRVIPTLANVLNAEERARMGQYADLIKGLVQKTQAEPEDYWSKQNGEEEEYLEAEIPEDIEPDAEDLGEGPPEEEKELNDSLTKESRANGNSDGDEFKVMDDFLKKESPDWTYFWVSCKLLGFDKEQVYKALKTESVKDLDKEDLNVFLRSQYAKQFGEPRI